MEQVDDGRWHHRFGASWLKTTDICLDRARREHTHEMKDVESDAANVGTAVHSAIQAQLEERNEGRALDRGDMIDIFNMEFSELMTNEHFTWIKYTEPSARKFGEACVSGWYTQVLDTLPTTALLETRFVLPFHEDDERVIELSGAIDYMGFNTELRIDVAQLLDWKTAGQEYKPWEKTRWDLQSTAYTWAAAWLGYTLHHPDEGEACEPIPFEFVVMLAHKVQRLTVTRGPEHWAFLQDKVVRIARLIESGLTPWPLNDNHALCSAKWCPAWDDCKGSHGITF